MNPSRSRTRPEASLYDSVRVALLAALVGVVAAYCALGFLQLIRMCQVLFFGFGHEHVYTALASLPAWRVVLAPALGGLLVGLVVWRWMPEQRNYGPADALEAVQEHDGRMPIGVGLGSALVSAVSIGAGASVGRYGPAVHLGASVSSWLAQILKLDRGQRIALVGSGAAAAIAASFNAPLGGILFATEVILGGRALRSFVPVTVAAVAGTAITRVHGGEFALFDLQEHHIEHVYEYGLFAVTGVVGGLLAVALMRSVIWSVDRVERSPLPLWMRPAIGGLLLGLIGTQFPHILGLGEQVILHSLTAVLPLGLLLGLIALKLLATSLSFGFGFSGGVFGPALFVGSALGSVFGQTMLLLFPELVSSPSIYALAGMGAVVGCVVGAPVATILVAFELTSSYSLATAVMVSVVFAHLASRRIFPYSHFTYSLHRRGKAIEIRREIQILRGRTVEQVLSPDVMTVVPAQTVQEVAAIMVVDRHMEVLMVDESGALRGTVSLADVIAADRAGRGADSVADVSQAPGLVIDRDMDLHTAFLELRDFVGVSIPVIAADQEDRLLGVIHENTLIIAYDDAVEAARREEQGIQ